CASSIPRPLVGDPPALIPSLRDTSPISDTVSSKGITIQRSDRDGRGKTWWWISGETKPVKDTLSLAGARWSRRRQQWYYIGEHLPESIRALGSTEPTSMPSDSAVLRDLLGLSGMFPNNGGAVLSSSGIATSTQTVPEPPSGVSTEPDLPSYTVTPIQT